MSNTKPLAIKLHELRIKRLEEDKEHDKKAQEKELEKWDSYTPLLAKGEKILMCHRRQKTSTIIRRRFRNSDVTGFLAFLFVALLVVGLVLLAATNFLTLKILLLTIAAYVLLVMLFLFIPAYDSVYIKRDEYNKCGLDFYLSSSDTYCTREQIILVSDVDATMQKWSKKIEQKELKRAHKDDLDFALHGTTPFERSLDELSSSLTTNKHATY